METVRSGNLSFFGLTLHMSSIVALCRWLIAKGCSMTSIVEVGSYIGISTSIFAPFFTHVYAVDSWSSEHTGVVSEGKLDCEGIEALFDANTMHMSNITKVKKLSVEAATGFEDSSLDFVYIDASHDYDSVMADLEAWIPKVRRYIGGHDYTADHPGVIKAVHDTFKPSNLKKALRLSDGSWWIDLEQEAT